MRIINTGLKSRMTSHELAHRLLELPDMIVETDDAEQIVDVSIVDYFKGLRLVLLTDGDIE